MSLIVQILLTILVISIILCPICYWVGGWVDDWMKNKISFIMLEIPLNLLCLLSLLYIVCGSITLIFNAIWRWF